MNVTIVTDATPDATKPGSILYRKAAVLQSALGWPIRQEPDPKADLNYFFPYLTWTGRFPGWRDTKIAAYFTHRDDRREGKRDQWYTAAEEMDVRVTSAAQFADDLARYGPTFRAKPPIDSGHFLPVKARPEKPSVPVIGVAGFVYGDMRKGEDLVTYISREFGKRVIFKGAGAGWSVPTQLLPFAELPDFYNSLDIFLCASRNEGVPMTVLEALACGVPVIVPEGVGIVDDLPDLRDIYRFKSHSEQHLFFTVAEAIRQTQMRKPDRDALRAVALEYSSEAWALDHVAAFEDVLLDAAIPAPEGGWQGRAGVYVVAFGGPSRDCARILIPSIKQHMPELPVALVSTKPLDAGEDVFIRQRESDIGGRAAKTRIDELAPDEWEYILYLDADTEVVADIGFLFDLLADGWEFVICKNPGKYHTARRMVRPDNKHECEETYDIMGTDEIIQLNGGVFAYRRNPRTRRFFFSWHREWDRYAGRDQAALLRALWANPLRVYMLGNEWNTVDRYCDVSRTAGIIHRPMTARRWTGIIHGRTDSEAAWRRVKE